MAQLKAGSTVGGVSIKSTTSTWGAGDLVYNTGVGTTSGYIRRAAGVDAFEITDSLTSGVVSPMQSGLVETYLISGQLVPSPTGGVYSDVIDKFPFTAPFTTASQVGTLSGDYRLGAASISTSTDGYLAGGSTSAGATNTITKIPMTAPTISSTQVGTLPSIRSYAGGHSSHTTGIVSGGGTPTVTASIYTFPFAAPSTSSTYVGNLSQAKSSFTKHQSTTTAYAAGGYIPAIPISDVDSFPLYAPFVTAANIGPGYGGVGRTSHSSYTHGYGAGGSGVPSGPGEYSTIVRFPFSVTPAASTTIGNLSIAKTDCAGSASLTHGYVSAGSNFNPGGEPLPLVEGYNLYSVVEQFPFSAPFTTATAVGDLSVARFRLTSIQR